MRRYLYKVLLGSVLLLASLQSNAVLKPLKNGDQGVKGMPMLPNGWPQLRNIIVKARIVADGNGYTYTYAISNSTTNSLPLSMFWIDLRVDPSVHPFSLQDTGIQHDTQQHNKVIISAPSVHPDKTLAPLGWKATKDNIWVEWGGGTCAACTQAGSSTAGFGFVSSRTPGIREFEVSAFDIQFRGTSITDEALAHELIVRGYEPNIPALFVEHNKAVEFVGKTIAPIQPPEPFGVSSWTVHMERLAEESRRLGWISSDEQLNALRALIKALDSTDRGMLKQGVDALVRYATEQRKAGHLTDEAEALMRLNALYLLSRSERR